MSKGEKKQALQCRIPVSTYKRLRQVVPGPHDLGTAVNEAILEWLGRTKSVSLADLQSEVARAIAAERKKE